MPEVPKYGETKMGFSFSQLRTSSPRYGGDMEIITLDIGFKLGIPISGTGIDINRLLMKKDRRWDNVKSCL